MEINREDFEKWLNSKPDDEIVGCTGRPRECPLANYLKDKDPTAKVIKVFGEKYEINDHEFQAPKWASDFVFCVDLEYPSPIEINAADAKELLTKIL